MCTSAWVHFSFSDVWFFFFKTLNLTLRLTHLESVEGPIIFERKHVVRDGKEVTVCRHQSAQVQSLHCTKHHKSVHQSICFLT